MGLNGKCHQIDRRSFFFNFKRFIFQVFPLSLYSLHEVYPTVNSRQSDFDMGDLPSVQEKTKSGQKRRKIPNESIHHWLHQRKKEIFKPPKT